MHKIRLAAKSKSMARIGPFPREDYIVGQKYRVWYEVENIGKTAFPGGQLWVQIGWPNGQAVGQSFAIKPLGPGESHTTKTRITDALARGFALFYAESVKAKDGKKVEVYGSLDKPLKEPIPKAGIFHIHSIYAKPPEEITEYWAMWISAISLLLFVVIETIRFIVWLVEFGI